MPLQCCGTNEPLFGRSGEPTGGKANTVTSAPASFKPNASDRVRVDAAVPNGKGTTEKMAMFIRSGLDRPFDIKRLNASANQTQGQGVADIAVSRRPFNKLKQKINQGPRATRSTYIPLAVSSHQHQQDDK